MNVVTIIIACVALLPVAQLDMLFSVMSLRENTMR